MTEGRDTDDRGNAISRWSRLKQREKQARDGAKTAPGEVAEAPSEGGELVADRDSDLAAVVEQLPDIETLEEGSDFTVFLKEGVPEALRRQALRKLWRLNPVFANLDGLNDYDEDFTIVTTLAENLQTVYQVGKGMPDPEPAEKQEGDEVEPDEEGEIAEVAQLQEESEPEAMASGTEVKDEALATSESPDAGDSFEQLDEPEPVRIRGDGKKSASSAARRRWAGFTS